MALVAGDLIDEARDFHEQFNEREIPNKMLLRALTRAEQTLYREVVHLAETALAVSVELDAIDLAFSLRDGEPLQLPAPLDDALTILALEATVNDELVGLDILHDEAGAFPSRNLVGRLIGRSLFLTPHPRTYEPGTAEYANSYDWSTITKLRVTGVPNPKPLTDLSSTLVAPDQARPYLVADLVSFMATRLNSPMALVLAQNAAEAKASVAHSFVDSTAASWFVRKV